MLKTAVTLLRGYGLQTWSFWQDPSQLMQVYPRDWQSLVNNCGIVQLFGRDPAAAARRLGIDVDAQAEDALADVSNAMLLLQQGRSSVAERIDYRTEPAMQGLFDPNPLHRRREGSIRRPRIPQEFRKQSGAEPSEAGDGFANVYEALRTIV